VTDVSKLVKLAGTLPGSVENNGLMSVLPDLLDNPNKERLAVIWYSAPTEDVDHSTSPETRIPKLKIHKLEPMGAADEATQALQQMVMEKAEERLGHTPLPFEQVDPDGVQVLPSGEDPEQCAHMSNGVQCTWFADHEEAGHSYDRGTTTAAALDAEDDEDAEGPQ
jgi:hypothetical protein